MNAELMGNLLRELWEAQQRYNSAIKAVQTEHASWPEVYSIGVIGELDEVLRASQWKYHHPGRHQRVDRVALAEELADLTKYVLCFWQEFGFGLEDLITATMQKTVRLEKRLTNEWFPPEGTNVLVTDLDGTVADFREAFARHVRIKDNVVTLAMDLDNGLAWNRYQADKQAWEEAGGYATLNPYPDAVDLLKAEAGRGTHIMVITARPADTIRRVWADTEDWLAAQGIQYHSLLMGRDERLVQLLRLVDHRNKVLLLEDDPQLAERAAKAGIPVWMRAQGYNRQVPRQPHLTRWNHFPPRVDWEAENVRLSV